MGRTHSPWTRGIEWPLARKAYGRGRWATNHGRWEDVSLNIKHPEAHRLAKELAAATGTSMTEVVTEALRERWLREQHTAARRNPDEKARLIERALAIGRDCAERLAKAELPENPDKLLFDENGLPLYAGR